MRMNRLIYALGIGCTLCACSTQDDPKVQEEQDFTKSNKYVTVSIVTPNDGTRADDDYPFDDGDAKEYDVNSVAFFFYDNNNNCIDTELKTAKDITMDDNGSENPAVTVIGTVEIELAANRAYRNVIAVINPNSSLFDSNNKLKTLSKTDILNHYANYSGSKTTQVEGVEKGNFTMSNSVYVDDADYTGTGGTSYVAVPITSHNIYTKEKNEVLTEELKAERAAKAINIYVERVCAKVTATAPEFKTFFIEDTGDSDVLKVITKSGEEATLKISATLKGIGLSVTSKNATLLKNIDGLSFNFDGATTGITGFKWNDYGHKRSYWENTLGTKKSEEGGGYNYYTWKEYSEKNTLTSYVNPNTEDETIFDGIEADHTTKLLVAAQLKYTLNGETKNLDLVRFSGGYWMADYLISYAASRAYDNIANIDFTKVEGVTTSNEETVKTAVDAVTKAFLEENISLTGNTTSKTDMVKAYLAKLIFDSSKLNIALSDGNIKTAVEKKVKEEIEETLKDITDRQIQYWKDGMTYFYLPIRHEGFTGLTGGKNGKYLNGVVRNHMYNITISKIWGLGTPVNDPEKPIDPERPEDAPDSYMTAKIHVLKWRVVSNDMILH